VYEDSALTRMARSMSVWKKMGTGAKRITEPLPESSPKLTKRGCVLGSPNKASNEIFTLPPKPTDSLRSSSNRKVLL